jgi:hypothetical protein
MNTKNAENIHKSITFAHFLTLNINTVKSFIFTLLIVLISIVCVCQNTKQIDVVYLKNGSVIKGSVIELIVDKTVKIQTSDSSLFVFNMNEVEKIVKREIPNDEIFHTFKRYAGKTFKSPVMLGGIVTAGFSDYHVLADGIVDDIYMQEKTTLPPLPNLGMGIAFEYRPLNVIGIELDLLFFSKGFQVNHADLRTWYVSAPLNFLIYFGTAPTSFFISFEASYRYLITSRITMDRKVLRDVNTLFNRHQLGVSCGIGFYRFRFTCGWDFQDIWSPNFVNETSLNIGYYYKFRTTSLNFMLSYSHKLSVKSPDKTHNYHAQRR